MALSNAFEELAHQVIDLQFVVDPPKVKGIF